MHNLANRFFWADTRPNVQEPLLPCSGSLSDKMLLISGGKMDSPIIKNASLILVDDDMIFCRTARQQLASFDFDVKCFHDYSALITALPTETPDLILLGILSEDDDGRGICRKIRSLSAVPIIMLSCVECSKKASNCLEAGADDYIIKPCDFQELGARVRAVIRRHFSVPTPRPSAHPELHYRLGFAGVAIDVMTGMIDGELSLQQLSDTEAALMQELIGSAPGTVCRERLSRSALRRPWSVGDRTIDVYFLVIPHHQCRKGQ